MNTKNKIIAILMAGIVAMAVGVPMAMGGKEATTSANVGNVCPVITGITITPDDDTGTTGVQVNPNACPAKKTVTVTVDVRDDNGYTDISSVKITDINPDPTSCGDPSPVTLGLKAGSGTTATYEGTFDMCCCDKAQTYNMTVVADDGTCTDTDYAEFEYTSMISLDIDFTAVSYGSVAVDVESYVFGDAVTTTADEPTVTNKGNNNMKISITATEMTPGTTYNSTDPDNVNMRLDAKVPGDSASTHGTDLTPGTAVSFSHSFVCNTPEAVDFSIKPPSGTLGAYTGQITIEGAKA